MAGADSPILCARCGSPMVVGPAGFVTCEREHRAAVEALVIEARSRSVSALDWAAERLRAEADLLRAVDRPRQAQHTLDDLQMVERLIDVHSHTP